MFDAVMGRQEQRQRLGAGTAVSVALHAALLGAAVVLPALHPVEPRREDLDRLVFVSQAPRLGTPDAPQAAPAAAQPRRARPARRLHTPRPSPPLTAAPTPVTDAIPQDGPADGDAKVGEPQADSVGRGLPTGVPDGLGLLGTREDTLHFGPGMTRPVRLSGPDPVYTREALEARVEGLLVVKCVLTTGGEVEDCRVLKGLPYMDGPVLQALSAQRYAPATFQGRPVRVGYVFNVRLKLPR